MPLRPVSVLCASITVVVLSACQPTPAPFLPVPVVTPSRPAAPAGEYKVALTDADGSVVRWNPCRPIRYVVNPAGGPSFALAEVGAAVAAIESASGLDLVYEGTTTERPVPLRPLRSPDRYGPGFTPILISFASATELPFGSPTASGWGQAVPVTDPTTGARQLVSGQVVLRPPGWTQGIASANPLSLMLRHELGHVIGLAHVSSTNEIMGIGGNGSARSWGPGDLRGLPVIGRPAGCLTDLG